MLYVHVAMLLLKLKFVTSICKSCDSTVVSTLRCGRKNPGSNPGHSTFLFVFAFYQYRLNQWISDWHNYT